jgi:hypothetical protein
MLATLSIYLHNTVATPRFAAGVRFQDLARLTADLDSNNRVTFPIQKQIQLAAMYYQKTENL